MTYTSEQIRKIAVDAARTVFEEASEKLASDAALKASVIYRDQTRELISESVKQTLIQLGISSSNPIEMQADMKHLRDWRKSVESIRTKGMLTIVGIAVSGTLAALLIGIKQLLDK